MQAQTTRRLREYRFNRQILIALVGVGLLIASIVGIRALTDGQNVSQTPALSPVAAPVVEDPPLPDGWVDPYFTDRPVVIPVEQDPPLPDGWADQYFNQAVPVPAQDTPLRSDSFHRPADSRAGDKENAAGYPQTVAEADSAFLNLDRRGADVVPDASASRNLGRQWVVRSADETHFIEGNTILLPNSMNPIEIQPNIPY